ncbi:hypothetical protein BH11PSE12_BH11PSE12_33560 [soil metagenome]
MILQNYSNDKSIMPMESNYPVWMIAGIIVIALLAGITGAVFGGEIALLAIFVVGLMVFALSDFRYGIVMVILLLPLSATNMFPRQLLGVIGFNPLNVALIFSALTLGLAVTFQKGKIDLPKCPKYLWIYVGLLCFATFQGALHLSSIPPSFKVLKVINFDSVGGYARDVLIKPIFYLITAYMVAVAIRNSPKPSRYLIPIFVSALVMPLVVIIYVAMSGASLSFLASSGAREFLSATGLHANELGLMFNMELALSLFCFFCIENKLAKWLLGILILIIVTATGLTFSRGAFLGFFVVIGYFLFTQKRFGIIAAGVILLPLLLFLMPQALIERATTGVNNNDVGAISAGRVDEIWLPLIPSVLSNPLIGQGLSSILWSEAAHTNAGFMTGKIGHPHSAYLGVLLDFGVLGAIVIVLFFGHIWYVFKRISRAPPEPVFGGFFKGAIACILLMMIQGVTDDRFTPTPAQTFLWLAYGIGIGLLPSKKVKPATQTGFMESVAQK